MGKITIRTVDLFDENDPRENHKLQRLANRLHRSTREGAIRSQLLLEPGDVYSETLAAESERVLRHDRYLFDGTVRPVAVHDGVVDLEVTTRDVWTLSAGVNFGRAGGEQSTSFRVEDTNLLGTGKAVLFEHGSDVDRISNRARYLDPNLLGSRVQLGIGLESNSDGDVRTLDFEKPFESLESRWAAGLRFSTGDRVDTFYSLGEIVDRFHHESTRFELSGGLSKGVHDGRTLRWVAGLAYEDDHFGPVAGFEAPSILPPDRKLVYPWLGLEVVSDRFAEVQDLDQMGRTEDLFLGTHLDARIGFASKQFGSDRSAAVFRSRAGAGWRFSDRQTVLVDGGISGRWSSAGSENLVLDAEGSYFFRNWRKSVLFASLSGSVADTLDPENQILLGGDNGLRGYPLRYQAGEGEVLVTLEQRFFTHWYPWRLFHVGAAVFFDAGRAWGQDLNSTPNLGWLKDIGIGLRLGSTRSSSKVLHLDIAFPLDGDGSIRGIQWLIKTKESL